MAKQDAPIEDTNTENKPAEEPAKTAPVDHTWDDDFDTKELTISYKREEPEEEVVEETTDKKNEVEEEEDAELPVVESVVTLEDPGEYKPEDLSFEYDIEGKKYTISSAEDIDKIPDEEKEKLSASQIITLLNKANAIQLKHDKAETEHSAKKEKYDTQVAEQRQREETINGYANEFDYLVSKGLIPEVPAQYKNANWQDPEVAKQDGVKEQAEILSYMVKENKARAKVGVKPLDSIVDTFNAMQTDLSRKKAVEDKKVAGQARKDASARVSGTTTTPQGIAAPKGIAVGRVNAFRSNQSVWEQ